MAKILSNIGGFFGSLWNSVKATFSKVFGSRKMLLAVISLAVLIVVNLAPELSTKAETIGNLIFAIASVGIFGITVEDSVTKWAARPNTADAALQVIKEGLEQPKGTVG